MAQKSNCCGQYFMSGNGSHALDSSWFMCDFCLWNLSEFCGEKLCERDIHILLPVEQPADGWNCPQNQQLAQVFLIFAQHELLWEISKLQGHSQGCAPVLFPSLVWILQKSRSCNEFDFFLLLGYFRYRFHFCCKLANVSVWVAFFNSARALAFAASAAFLICGVHTDIYIHNRTV